VHQLVIKEFIPTRVYLSNVFLVIAMTFPRIMYLTTWRAGWYCWDASICLRVLCCHKSILLRNGQECFPNIHFSCDFP